jgi:mycothiol synthase
MSWEAIVQAKQREFCGAADIEAMGALARAFPGDHLHVVDLPYRFSSWAIDDPENVGLWAGDDGQLVAWAVMQVPFWTIDHACHPQAGPELHRQVLDWADQRARQALGTSGGRRCWFVMVLGGQHPRIRDLEAAGFACQADVGEDSWSKVLMARAAGAPESAGKLPAGFTIRPLAGASEVTAYVDLHREVFESRSMTVEWRARTLRCPEYVPELDLVAVGTDGRLAAFCVCWLDRHAEEANGQIEPLGVRPDLVTLGLGRAILAEGLERLHSMGARQVYVETDSYRNPALRLYESAGFRVIRNVLVYRKDYEGA